MTFGCNAALGNNATDDCTRDANGSHRGPDQICGRIRVVAAWNSRYICVAKRWSSSCEMVFWCDTKKNRNCAKMSQHFCGGHRKSGLWPMNFFFLCIENCAASQHYQWLPKNQIISFSYQTHFLHDVRDVRFGERRYLSLCADHSIHFKPSHYAEIHTINII